MKPLRTLRRADVRSALLAAAERLITQGLQPFSTADIERSAGQSAGSIDDCFGSRTAFAKALADTVKRTLLDRWTVLEPQAAESWPTSTKTRAVASTLWPPPRAALVEAGKRLLASGRLDAMSIDGIVLEAGVGKGSFFNYFGSRDELLRVVVRTVQDELAEAVNASLTALQDPVGQIAHGFVATLRYGLSNQLGARAMTRVTPDAIGAAIPVNFQLRRTLRAGMVEGGLVAKELDAAAVMLIGLSEAGLMRLLAVRQDVARVDGLLRELCLTALQMLGIDARRHEVLVDAAMRVEHGG